MNFNNVFGLRDYEGFGGIVSSNENVENDSSCFEIRNGDRVMACHHFWRKMIVNPVFFLCLLQLCAVCH